MGLVNEQARGSLRFSFGRFNNEADIDRALRVIREELAPFGLEMDG
jgi:cysteine sulfinate desulfinase/cysteine desulfurase-like protein